MDAVNDLTVKRAKRITGLVLARGGSKGIPGKNIRDMCGKPLLAWILDAAKAAAVFDKVYVSTEDPVIAAVAEEHGAVAHRRPDSLAQDTSMAVDGIKEFLSKHPEVEVVGIMQCTTPTTHPAHLREACGKIWDGFDSVFSVVRLHLFRWSEVESGEFTKPLNFNPNYRPRRQDWSGELFENGAICFFTKELLLEDGCLQGRRCCYIEMPEYLSCDIDLPSDWELAELRVEKHAYNGEPLPSYTLPNFS